MIPDNDNNRQTNKSNRSKKILLAILLVIIVIVFAIFALHSYYQTQLEPVDTSATEESVEEIEIPSGASITDIANILEQEGLINSSLSFQLYTRLNDASNLQAGYYNLSPAQSTQEIVTALQEGGQEISSEDITTLTFPEGSNVLQVAEIISNELDYTVDDVIEVLEDEAFIEEMFANYPEIFENYPIDDEEILYTLEGYLYPATYEFYVEDDLYTLIEQMIANTDQKYSQISEDIETEDYTFHELLTLASIVEHEAANEEDRRLIAGVFLNRLEIDMPMETNVSFSYLEGEHMETVSYEDTEVDSPYNLYRYTGLGPGPINNPSIESVEAVLNPEESEYFFFLSDIYTEETYFSETYEEHLEKQELYVNSYTSESSQSQETTSSETE